jgi:superfamily I DNA/RNA helicase
MAGGKRGGADATAPKTKSRRRNPPQDTSTPSDDPHEHAPLGTPQNAEQIDTEKAIVKKFGLPSFNDDSVPSYVEMDIDQLSEWVKDPNAPRHGIIAAAAGAGKTTSILRAMKEIRSGNSDGAKILYLAFNQQVAIDMTQAVKRENLGKKIDVCTFHGFGFDILKKTGLNLSLYKALGNGIAQVDPGSGRSDLKKFTASPEIFPMVPVEELSEEIINGSESEDEHSNTTAARKPKESKEARQKRNLLVQVTSALQSQGILYWSQPHVTPQDWRALLSMQIPGLMQTKLIQQHMDWLVDAVPQLLSKLLTLAVMGIDFEEMTWYPLFKSIVKDDHWKTVTKYDWIFIDEAQDLNGARLALVMEVRCVDLGLMPKGFETLS